METDDKLRSRLRYLNQLLLACLLLSCTVLACRLAVLVGHTKGILVSISQDLKDVSNAAGIISRDVETLRSQINGIQNKIDRAIPDEKVTQAWRDAKSIKNGLTTDTTLLSGESRAEITELFALLSRSDLKFQRKKKTRPISYLHARLYPKYISMQKTLTSSEDFIAKVATHTILGNAYVVLDTNGTPHQLSDWLTLKLESIRTTQPDTQP